MSLYDCTLLIDLYYNRTQDAEAADWLKWVRAEKPTWFQLTGNSARVEQARKLVEILSAGLTPAESSIRIQCGITLSTIHQWVDSESESDDE